MRTNLILAALAVACLQQLTCSTTQADMIFTITPGAIASLPIGGSVQLSINIATDFGTVTNLTGVDFRIHANDPGLTGNVSSGGQFIAGTSTLFSEASGSYKLLFPRSAQIFGAAAESGFTVTTTPAPLATITLSTAGAIEGNYAIGLNVTRVLVGEATPVVVQQAPALAYTVVSAVPEPTSSLFAFGAIACGGLRWVRMRRLKHQSRTR